MTICVSSGTSPMHGIGTARSSRCHVCIPAVSEVSGWKLGRRANRQTS